MSANRIYLDCPFEDKDQCKQAGGRWDASERKWYITDEMDTTPFSKWLKDSSELQGKTTGKRYPRAFQKFTQLVEQLEELRGKPSASDMADSEAERLLWNSLDAAEEYLNRAFEVVSPNMAIEQETAYALAYADLRSEYLDPTEREKLRNQIKEDTKADDEEFYSRLEQEAREDEVDLARAIEMDVFAEEGYTEGLSPFTNDESANNDEEGWPYDD